MIITLKKRYFYIFILIRKLDNNFYEWSSAKIAR